MSTKHVHQLQIVKPSEGSAAPALPGRVTHDARGNAIWDWAISTGVLARKSVAELITSLDETGELALAAEQQRDRDWSGDPYNRSTR
ncbi:MAG TPA: hypothetical protein VIY54_13505 [Steroidobacteraceae bacterium]